MTIVERVRAAWRFLGEWAEAVDFDPVEDLHRRVNRLERQLGTDAGRQQPPLRDEPEI